MKSTIPFHQIKTEFSLPHATTVGGSKIFLDYLEKIKLGSALQQISGTKAKNALFPVYRILLYLIVGWILGAERLF
ncbi:IS1380 family transposase, partial [Paenibacillus sp. S150]|nr:IS1380 family transposase [Paenibacillus sp. S150]